MSFDLLLPPPLPFLSANRAVDSRSAPHSKYYQPSIIYHEQSDTNQSNEHEKHDDWTLAAPAKESRWTSDISMINQQQPTTSPYQSRPTFSPKSGHQASRTVPRSFDKTSTHSSPLSCHQEEEDLSCELDNLSVNTSCLNERQISQYQTTYCDHFDEHNDDRTLYERVTLRPIGRSYNHCLSAHHLHSDDEQQSRSEPSVHQSINVHYQSVHLSAHIQPFDGPSSLIYSTTTLHGRLTSTPKESTNSNSRMEPFSSSTGLFIETDSAHDSSYDCYADTASLSSASFSSLALSPCHSPTSPFFDTSLPNEGAQDPVLYAGLDVFASQLNSARLRIISLTSPKEDDDQ
jgi:hypothetical protein